MGRVTYQCDTESVRLGIFSMILECLLKKTL